MTTEQLSSPETQINNLSRKNCRLLIFSHYLNRVLLLAAVVLFLYGLGSNYSTRRYLKGFSDAIVPLEGSPEAKSEALLGWLREEPDRRNPATRGTGNSRDPVGIVQD